MSPKLMELTKASVDDSKLRRSSIHLEINGGMDNHAFQIEESETGSIAAVVSVSHSEWIRRSGENPTVTYSWNNISAWIGPGKTSKDEGTGGSIFCRGKQKNKIILNKVSGVVRPGQLVALMGSSGSGKTTLIDILTFRNSSKIKVTGKRLINNAEIKSNTITPISAYVQQNDLFVGVLTVREHLIFQAQVRMDADLSFSKRMERVEKVIQELGLTKCADSRIGTKWLKGISGGEMRRLSIATELLTDPMFMCCDEPLSGLDSNSARNVMTILKGLANTGKTVICSIHQPSSQIYALFDRVMYMSNGRVAYLGPSDKCLEFFNEVGYECPARYNPADFIIDTLSTNTPEGEVRSKEICDAFNDSHDGKAMRANIRNRTITVGDEYISKNSSMYKASIVKQFGAVTKRSWISFTRDPMVLKMKIFQSVFLGLFVGTIYFQEDIRHVDGIQNLSGAIFMMLCAITYQYVFGVLDNFCTEVPLFLREHFNGMYRTDVYFISKVLVEIPFYILLPSVQVAIMYYMIGFDPDIASFLKTTGVLVLVAYICAGVGIVISCISQAVTIALLLAPCFVFPFFLFGGFLVQPGTGVVFLKWVQSISFFFYGYESIAIVQLEVIDHFDCGLNNATCPENGLAVLRALKFNENNLLTDYVALGGIAIGVTVLGYLALLLRTLRR